MKRNRRQFLFCANQHGLGLVTVQLQFVLGHPVFDSSETVRRSFYERRDILWFRAALELRVVSVEMMVQVILFDDVGERRSVESEEDWS